MFVTSGKMGSVLTASHFTLVSMTCCKLRVRVMKNVHNMKLFCKTACNYTLLLLPQLIILTCNLNTLVLLEGVLQFLLSPRQRLHEAHRGTRVLTCGLLRLR